MKKLHHPGTPCNKEIKDIDLKVANLGNNLEAVISSEGWGLFGKDFWWASDNEIHGLDKNMQIIYIDLPRINDFTGWGFYSPINLEIELTRDCNQDCIHCWNESGDKISLDTKILDEIITEFREGGGQRISITGGEPLMYKNLFSFLDLAKRKGIRFIDLSSNGSLIDEKKAELLSHYLTRIHISLHGGNSKIHNKIVQRENFDATVNSIKYLNQKGVEVVINYTIMRGNAKSILDVFELSKSLGGNRIRFNLVRNEGRGKSLEKISQEEVFILRKIIEELSERTGVPLKRSELYPEGYYKDVGEAKFYGCSALRTSLYLDAYGNFLPCSLAPISIGNIRKDSLIRVWGGNLSNKIRKITYCENLSCSLSCGGRCKAKEISCLETQKDAK